MKAAASVNRCPICEQKACENYRPFCSKRCADVDLGRWFGSYYSVPADDQLGEREESLLKKNNFNERD